MKPLTILGTVLTATLLLSACDPHRKVREKPAPTNEPKPKTQEKPQGPGTATIDPGNDEPSSPKPREDVKIEPKPNIPPPPSPEGKEEYAAKMAGRPGFVTDPHDPQGRPLDVRGMPPGTKIQSPFSGSVLLVPPQ